MECKNFLMKEVMLYFRKPPISAVFASNTTSPNSSTSGSSSVTPIRSHGRSTSSKESTTSTLTPSPSPTPGKVNTQQSNGVMKLAKMGHVAFFYAPVFRSLKIKKFENITE